MRKGLWIVVNLTFDCVSNCSWCYTKYINKSNVLITTDVINQLVFIYKKHVSQYGFSEHNTLVVLGGESLLYPALVKELFTKFLMIQPRINFLDIYTNGLLLDEDFIKWTKEIRLGIHFSANESSSEFIAQTLTKIAKYRKYSTLTIPLSFENLNRLDTLIDLAHNSRMQLRLRHLYQGGNDPEYMRLYDEVLPQSIKRIMDKDFLFYPHLLYEMTTPFWPIGTIPKDKFVHLCGKNYFVIDPNGNVRTCLAQNDKIGNLFDKDFDFFVNVVKYRKYAFDEQADKIEECKKCGLRVICGGGCPLTKLHVFGTIYKPSPFCSTFKKVFPMIIAMGEKWIELGRSIRY